METLLSSHLSSHWLEEMLVLYFALTGISGGSYHPSDFAYFGMFMRLMLMLGFDLVCH